VGWVVDGAADFGIFVPYSLQVRLDRAHRYAEPAADRLVGCAAAYGLKRMSSQGSPYPGASCRDRGRAAEPSQFALFEAASGIGSILASLMIPRFQDRLTGRRVLGASGACYGLAACLFTGTALVPVAYIGAFTWGITGAVFGTVTLTTIQQAVPVQAHGRIMGVTAAIQSWIETIGLLVGGVTLAALGIRAGALALAGVTVLAGMACLVISG
jgi:hypothetical protein